jgi:hypothetical protein
MQIGLWEKLFQPHFYNCGATKTSLAGCTFLTARAAAKRNDQPSLEFTNFTYGRTITQCKKARNDWKHITTMKDTPMKSRPARPFSHSNKNPLRETVAEENEDDCSCSTDAVTVKVSNVVSFHRPPSSFFRLFHYFTVILSLSSSYLLSLYISIPWNVQRTRKRLVSEEKALVSFPQALFFIRKMDDDRDLARAHAVFALRLNRILSHGLARSNRFFGA